MGRIDRRAFLVGLLGCAALGYVGIRRMTAATEAVPTLTTLHESADLTTANGQGVAFDGIHYYTNDGAANLPGSRLRKFTRSGGTYTQVASADILSALAPEMTQANSVVLHSDRLWLGANNFDMTPTGPKASWVVEVDPSDLSHVATYPLEDVAWCEGGAWKDVGDGDEFWAVFHDTKTVSRYKLIADVMVKQAEYTLPLIPDAEGSGALNQGAQWLDNQLWTQLHNQHSETGTYIHEWTGNGFVGIGFIPALGSPDEAGQGLHWETVGEVMLFAVRGTNTLRILRAAVDNEIETGVLAVRRIDGGGSGADLDLAFVSLVANIPRGG